MDDYWRPIVLSLSIIMIVVTVAEIVIAIVSAVLTCKPLCSCCTPKTVPYGMMPQGRKNLY